MKNKIIHDNILIFKISQDGEICNLNTEGEFISFIADMQDLSLETIELIKNKLVIFGQSIYEKNGSFVVVCNHIFDKNLNIVPTMKEAFDFIEMEDIERQLDF